jgi:CubicO group peptidase (beta-lactamase class C family)
MEDAIQSRIAAAVERAIARYRVPGIVVLAVDPKGTRYWQVSGTDARGIRLDRDSLFPVASITKLATALAVLRLVESGLIDLDRPISASIPEATAKDPGVTPRRLLSHASGLPYELDDSAGPLPPAEDWPRLAERCRQTPLEARPGTRVRYSNVGYGLLAILVEQALGVDFPSALTDLVVRPLGIEAYFGAVPPRSAVRLSDVRGTYAGTEFEAFNTDNWYRRGLPWSGLLTTASGALRLVQEFGDAPSLIRPETSRAAVSNQTDALSGGFVPPLVWKTCWWGLGPDVRDNKSPHWTPATANSSTFGHAGASGTLAYVDPVNNVAWAILGSRTADNGWLLLAGPAIASLLLDEAAG